MTLILIFSYFILKKKPIASVFLNKAPLGSFTKLLEVLSGGVILRFCRFSNTHLSGIHFK